MIEIPQPDDWHVHLRDDDMLQAVVGYTARRFRYAMVMPNLATPVVSTAAATAYLDRIRAATPSDALDFRPVMTLYCSSAIDPGDLRAGIEKGLIAAVKYYPAGATTNSAAGGSSMADFMPIYETLVETGARLLVHAESTDPAIDIFAREEAFLVDQLAPLCARIPELAVTVEHISTSAGADFVREHPNTAATITPHHLARERSDLLADGMRPDLYCKPVINSASDRDALLGFATSGDPNVFLGTDSAPHPTSAKYGPKAKAGVFNAAYGLEVVAETFHQLDALDQLAAFVSTNGCAVYGVEPPEHTLHLTREAVDADRATELHTASGDTVVLFGTDEASLWTVAPG
ncbi:MAG: dihydroorotase [Acidimicrobiales bacterium]|nr:MAG: dihydroorotase [Acidimicrobiales bacterium]